MFVFHLMRKQRKRGNKATVNHGCTCNIYKSNTNFDSKAEFTCQDHVIHPFGSAFTWYISVFYMYKMKLGISSEM